MEKQSKEAGLKIVLVATLVLSLIPIPNMSCSTTQNFDRDLNEIVQPYIFSFLQWELKTLPVEVNPWALTRYQKNDDEVGMVIQYFELTDEIKALNSELNLMKDESGDSLDSTLLQTEIDQLLEQKSAMEDTVEIIIEKQISEVLVEQCISNPLDNLKWLIAIFPPANLQLENPPYLLVVSPRDKIEMIRGITLKRDTSLDEIKYIEDMIDQLDVSSLVVPLGGLGATYPSLVSNECGLKHTIDTAVEEWLHQYLVFKPLGFLYLLHVTDVSRDYEIVTINETVANMTSKEIGSIIYNKYYAGLISNNDNNTSTEDEFDFFYQEMKDIRSTVDEYLERGDIEQAEEFMEEKRQYLIENGYYVRKLNQAYFAFYGSYADSPTSISPIGADVRNLRNQSTSLKDFLDTAAMITSYHDLQNIIK